MGKKIWTSKIVWVNIIALVLAMIQSQTGWAAPPEMQGALLTLVNVALRAMTKEPVRWK